MAGNKGTTFDNDLMKLIFNATAIGNLADNAAISPNTAVYLSLHTADPTAGNTQSSSEATYTGYTRVSIYRDTVNSPRFTVSGNTATLNQTVSFPACTAGTNTITYFAVGTASSGTGKILYTGPVSPSISVASGVTPQLTTSTTISES